MDFKWLPGKVGAPVTVTVPVPPSPSSAPDAPAAPNAPSAPNAPTITGVVVPPAVDTALRGVHSTWEASLAALLVGALALIGVHLPLAATIILTGLLTGAAAVARSVLARKTGAKA
jgi:hypothetical protein